MKKSFFTSKRFMILVSFVGLYLLSAGASLAIFSYLNGSPALDFSGNDITDTRSKITVDMPKTEECPINGALFTKAEKSIWETRRPIVAMIENHADSRPQSGVSKADVVYEAVAEGGITRFLTVFYCGAAAQDVQIAPVRSARVYFVNWAAGYGDRPIFMHVGGANDYGGTGETVKDARALELLETMGWRIPKGNDFDTTYDSGFPVFWRNYDRLDHPVATEHTMMASLDAAYVQAANRGFGYKDSKGNKWNADFTAWKFADDKPQSPPSATKISFEFWSNKPDYDVTWNYNAETNSYLRENGGKPQTDFETNTQLSAKNVVILFTTEKGPVDKNLHMLYGAIGSGKAIVFQNGQAIEGNWEKATRDDMITFKDKSGREISFVRGVTWVEVVPNGNSIDY